MIHQNLRMIASTEKDLSNPIVGFSLREFVVFLN